LNILQNRQTIVLTSFLIILIVCLIPLFQLALSFDFSVINNVNTVNLSTLFFDSILIVGAASLIAMFIGGVLAYYLATVHIRFSIVLILLLLTNFFIPSYIHALSWSRLFMDESILNTIAIYTGMDIKGSTVIDGWFGTVWVLALSYFPIIFVAVYLSCLRWGQSMQNAALMFGSPSRARIIRLTFLRVPLLVSTLLVFLLIFSDFGVPDLFQIPMYSTEIFIQLSSYYNNSNALFISLPYIITSCIILWWIISLTKKISLSLSTADSNPSKVRVSGPVSFLVHTLLYGCIFIVIVLPLLNLIYLTQDFEMFFRAFELVKTDLLNSTLFAGFVSIVIVLFALYASYGYVRLKSHYKEGLRIIIFLMLVLPASLLALSLISFWNQEGMMGWFYQSEGIVVLGVSIRWLPIAFEILLIGWLFVNEKQENAALVFGVGWWSVVKNIHFPQMKPFILSVFILCFVLAFNELTMMVLLSPPGLSLLPGRIFSVIHYGPENLLAAICLIQVITILVIVSSIAWYNRHLIISTQRA